MAEKFKPVPFKEFDPELKEIYQKTEHHWLKDPVIKNYHGSWREDIKWFEGDQYVFWNDVAEALQSVTPILELEGRSIFVVMNKILPIIRQLHGEMRYEHIFYGEGSTTEDEDTKAAHAASMVIGSVLDRRKFNPKISDAKLWALITGQCYWKEWWNKNLFGIVRSDSGTTAKENGDIDMDIVIPFNVRPDPEAKDRDGWRWFIEGKRVAKDVVEDEFDLPRGTLDAESKEKTDSGIFERWDLDKSDENTVVRMEFHEKGNKRYPQGRFFVCASNYALYHGPNGSPDQEIPYFMIPGLIPILGDQYYRSMVSVGRPAQQRINKIASKIDEYWENARLKAMIARGSLDPKELEMYTRAGVDWIFYNSMVGAAPFWQSPPDPPAILMDRFAQAEREIEVAMSVREVSMARLPKYSTRASGKLWERLKGQDEKVLMPWVEDLDVNLQDAAKFILKLAKKHYSIPRLFKVIGKDKRRYIVAIKGADLRDDTDIKVRSGADIFTNREYRQDIIMSFVDKGVIKDPREAFDLMEGKGVEEYIEEQFIDQRQAQRENDMIREGRVKPAVHKDDNHTLHFKIHDDDRKKEEYRSWSKKSQEWLEEHKAGHKALQAQAEKAAAPSIEKVAGAPAPGGLEGGPATMPEEPPDLTTLPPELLNSPETAALMEALEQVADQGVQ
jgi:hypothetical protein